MHRRNDAPIIPLLLPCLLHQNVASARAIRRTGFERDSQVRCFKSVLLLGATYQRLHVLMFFGEEFLPELRLRADVLRLAVLSD